MYSKDKRPLVSVVMPAYNAEKYIAEAMESVIAQTYTNWELFVVDDCSADNTANIVQSFEDKRISYIKNPENLGPAFSRNCGIEAAKGEYIALIDSDDIWHENKLEKQIELAKKTGADIIYCSYGMINDAGVRVNNDYIVTETTDFEKTLKENMLSCSTVLIKSELLKKYKFSSQYYHEDYVLWLMLLKEGNEAVGIAEVLADYRLLENSRSFNKKKSAKNRWRIYRKRLKLPIYKSLYYMCAYILAGLKKYAGKKK